MFVRAYTRNSKTRGRIQTLYLSNNCSTIEDAYFLLQLDARYDWQVMAPNTHHSFLFPVGHLFVLTRMTHECSEYQTTTLLSSTFLAIVWFRVAREIQLESYDPRHASAVL